MNRILLFTIAILLATLLYSVETSAQKKQYTSTEKLTLVGKAQPTSRFYHRVDTTHYRNMPVVIKKLYTNSASLAICFSTNRPFISAMLADIDADASILDCIPNPSPDEIRRIHDRNTQ